MLCHCAEDLSLVPEFIMSAVGDAFSAIFHLDMRCDGIRSQVAQGADGRARLNEAKAEIPPG